MGGRSGGSFHDGHSHPTGPALIGLGKVRLCTALLADRPRFAFAMTAAPDSEASAHKSRRAHREQIGKMVFIGITA